MSVSFHSMTGVRGPRAAAPGGPGLPGLAVVSGHNRGMSRRPPSPVSTRSGAQTARAGAARPGRARRSSTDLTESRPVRLARVLSVRAIVLGVVLLAGFTLLFPTVRAYLGQRAELDALEAQVAQAEQDERALERDLDRWQDPAYVAAQARERLSYVLPGETAYRVIDPEVVVEPETDRATPAPEAGPALPTGGAVTPWYTTVWQSLEVAGSAEVPDTAAEDQAGEDGQ